MGGRHAAVVLAAGGSVRLGRPKQLLTRDGETLVHRAVRLAQDTSPTRLFVVVGACTELVVPELDAGSCEVVHNPEWREGLASSLRAVAAATRDLGGPVLVMGCDQPALESRHLVALLDGARSAASGAAATRYDEVVGVPAVVPGTWFSRFELSEDRGFGPLLRALPRDALILVDAPELRLDIDSPQDAIEAIEHGWLDAIA
jgi:molybdenum cofactor cytidylyltransferase